MSFNLFFKINRQFHYLLLTRPTHLLYPHPLLVMTWTHIVKFLLKFSVFCFVLLFLPKNLILNQWNLFITQRYWVDLVVYFRTSLCRSLRLELYLKTVILRLDHYYLTKRHQKCRIIKFKFMIYYVNNLTTQHFIKENISLILF